MLFVAQFGVSFSDLIQSNTGLPKVLEKCNALFSKLNFGLLCVFQAVAGSEECVSALLVHGAFALCRDVYGRSPLHLAASCGHTWLLRPLLDATSLSDTLDSLLDYSAYTPTHWAAYHGKMPFHSSIETSAENYNNELQISCLQHKIRNHSVFFRAQ